MEELDLIKWWGAIIATVALGWNVFGYFGNSPKLKVRLKLPVSYLDGRVLSVTKLENGERHEIADYCHIEITNIGKLPATVTSIQATHKDKGGGRIIGESQRFHWHHGVNLPILVSPGELCSCRLEMEDLYRMESRGKPEIRIDVSYRDKALVVYPEIPARE